MAEKVTFTPITEEVIRLKNRIRELEDRLRGVEWLISKGALVRNTRHDERNDYHVRAIRFTKWLLDTFSDIDAAREGE